jgi:hypothetical protein
MLGQGEAKELVLLWLCEDAKKSWQMRHFRTNLNSHSRQTFP